MFLLDTHVWVWALEHDTRRLGRRTFALLDRWAEQGALRVSPLSAFEVMALNVAGRIQLSRPAEQWIDTASAAPGLRLAPLTIDAAMDAGRIGVTHLADPIDRMLVATARQLDGTLVTRDRGILGFAARTSAVRVHDAAR